MDRQQDGQLDEVALAKERLRAVGEEIDALVRHRTRHAAIIGVAASFGAGLLFSSGSLRPLKLLRAATFLPQLLTYTRFGKETLTMVNQIIAGQRARGAGGESPPGR